MVYTLTIIRLIESSSNFCNTECNTHCEKETLISTFLAIPCEESAASIITVIDNLKLGQSKTIQLNNSKTNLMWFCYINCVKSVY